MSNESAGTVSIDDMTAILSSAQTDPAFRNELLTSASATLQSQGITVPVASLEVLENSSTLANLVIPAMPANLSASEQQELTSLANSSVAPNSALDAYAKLIIDAWHNGDLKQRLLTEPAAVIAERGITIPAGVSVKAIEATGTSSYLVLPPAASATSSGATLGSMAESIADSFTNLTKLITAGSYIAGLAFSIGAVMKFQQHKDNPTQIPIGMPIALIFVGAALLFLPSILSTTGTTMFGDGGTTAGPTGVSGI
jgi:intracellular multiplication protein IcmD